MDNQEQSNKEKPLSDDDLIRATADFCSILIMSTPKRVLMLTAIMLTRFFSETDEMISDWEKVQAIEKSKRRLSN